MYFIRMNRTTTTWTFLLGCSVMGVCSLGLAQESLGFALIGTTASTAPKIFDAMDSDDAWQDALAVQRQAAIYGVQNADNPKIDMARGTGEYISSFATILNITKHQFSQVFKIAQHAYPSVWQPGMPAEQSMNELLLHLAEAHLVASPALVVTEPLPR